jgi:hypothetical protein
MTQKTEPKFKVGQVVIMKNLHKQLPFKIIGTRWEDGWFYQWNRNNYASEGMIRELNSTEKGE